MLDRIVRKFFNQHYYFLKKKKKKWGKANLNEIVLKKKNQKKKPQTMESKNVPIENLGGNQEKKRGQELKYCLNITFSKIIPDEKQKLVVKSQDHLLNSHFWFVLN